MGQVTLLNPLYGLQCNIRKGEENHFYQLMEGMTLKSISIYTDKTSTRTITNFFIKNIMLRNETSMERDVNTRNFKSCCFPGNIDAVISGSSKDTKVNYNITASDIADIELMGEITSCVNCDRFECDSINSLTFYSEADNVKYIYWNGSVYTPEKIRGTKVADNKYRVSGLVSMKNYNTVVVETADNRVFVSQTVSGYEPIFNDNIMGDYEDVLEKTTLTDIYVKIADDLNSVDNAYFGIKSKPDIKIPLLLDKKSMYIDDRDDFEGDNQQTAYEANFDNHSFYVAKHIISKLIHLHEDNLSVDAESDDLFIVVNGFNYAINNNIKQQSIFILGDFEYDSEQSKLYITTNENLYFVNEDFVTAVEDLGDEYGSTVHYIPIKDNKIDLSFILTKRNFKSLTLIVGKRCRTFTKNDLEVIIDRSESSVDTIE